MSKYKYALSDELWEKIQEFIPARNNTHPRGGGRKPKDDRLVFEAILFVLRFGCQWNALDASGLCPSSTVHDRFQKWVKAGVFHRLLEAGLLDDGATKGIDWSWLTLGEGQPQPQSSGRKRGRGKSTRSWQEKRRAPIATRYASYAPGVKP